MNEVAGALVGFTLAELGVESVFGVVGSGNYVATDALVRGGARYVAARHEAGAVGMADGHYRSTGKCAVASVHQGPGLTNAMTALTEASKSRVPMVVVAGATSAGMGRSNFYIDQSGLAAAAGAVAVTADRPDHVVEDTVRAYRTSVAMQRPVVLNLPLDVQASAVPQRDATVPHPTRHTLVTPSGDAVSDLARRLEEAERPLLIAGRGAWRSGAREALQELAHRVGAMLATTAVVKGLFAGHPRDLGISGGFSSPATVEALEAADLIVGFGCSFTHWTTRSGTIFEGSTLVQVDTDAASLALDPHVDVGLLGDVWATTAELLDVLGTDQDERAPWASALEPPRTGFDDLADAGGHIHPLRFTLELEDLLPSQRTLVLDGGHFIGWPAMHLSVPDPGGFLFSSAGFQSIGLGLGMAIGAALGRPDRLSVLTIGDGGFLMSVAELETLVRLQLPVLVAVYNDAAYGAEVHHFRDHGSGLELVQFPPTDIAALARGAGAEAVTVRSVDDLAPVKAWLGDPRGPLVVDARIRPDVVGPWAAQDFVGH